MRWVVAGQVQGPALGAEACPARASRLHYGLWEGRRDGGAPRGWFAGKEASERW